MDTGTAPQHRIYRCHASFRPRGSANALGCFWRAAKPGLRRRLIIGHSGSGHLPVGVNGGPSYSAWSPRARSRTVFTARGGHRTPVEADDVPWVQPRCRGGRQEAAGGQRGLRPGPERAGASAAAGRYTVEASRPNSASASHLPSFSSQARARRARRAIRPNPGGGRNSDYQSRVTSLAPLEKSQIPPAP